MQALFSIILPLLAICLFLNLVPSFPLSCPSPPPFTATAQYSYLNYIPAFSFVFFQRAPFRPLQPSSTSVAIFSSFFLSPEMEKSIQVQAPPSPVAHPGSLTL